ncbi:MAG: hypothetical protein IJ184_03195 [Alphaproteobacteria bacterium]|nr:hypothetical protein [Alphaproteobacteria bacterium]
MAAVMYFSKARFALDTGIIRLEYDIDDKYHFTEEYEFPNAPFYLSEQQKATLKYALNYLHIAAGVSYYKTVLPYFLALSEFTINEAEAAFFNKFYINGLGEFAARNRLNFFSRINFPYTDVPPRKAEFPYMADEALIPVGGGKDSCVTIKLAQEMGIESSTIACGDAAPIQNVMDITGGTSYIIKRRISPNLAELNASGNVYNGHVPVTGILAFVMWIAAIVYNKKYVMMSCERSASEGNFELAGITINHQYSKSAEFERDFYALTRTITPEFRYFSLLRPLSEVHIAKLFCEKCADYFDVFTSCNKAFKLDKTARLDHWCGNCDKCRFVFLVLALFMEKQKLIEIIGKNPLDDATQIEGYKELLGLKGHKPFECVGTKGECRFAFYSLSQKPEWQNDCVIKALSGKIPPQSAKKLFIPNKKHLIPKEFGDVLARFE